jgi:stress-induced morphogen
MTTSIARWKPSGNMRADDITAKIRTVIPDADVALEDLTGTLDHWKAVIVSDAFAGLSPMARQRLVMGALADELKGPIHAFTMETWTPGEVARRRT